MDTPVRILFGFLPLKVNYYPSGFGRSDRLLTHRTLYLCLAHLTIQLPFQLSHANATYPHTIHPLYQLLDGYLDGAVSDTVLVGTDGALVYGGDLECDLVGFLLFEGTLKLTMMSSTSLFISWALWLAAAAAITHYFGGSLNCGYQNSYVYCGQNNALIGFAWLIWWVLLSDTYISMGGIFSSRFSLAGYF